LSFCKSNIRKTPNLRFRDIKDQFGNNVLIYSEFLPIELQKGIVIDFETTLKSEPFTLGFVRRNKIIIYQLLDDIYDWFFDFIKERLWNDEFIADKLTPPYFAYNASFEKDIFDKIGIETLESDWYDLMQSVPYLNEDKEWKEFDHGLMKKEYHIHIPGIDFGTGKNMPYLWSAYLKETDDWSSAKIIYNIIRHNRACLYKELFLYIMSDGGNIV